MKKIHYFCVEMYCLVSIFSVFTIVITSLLISDSEHVIKENIIEFIFIVVSILIVCFILWFYYTRKLIVRIDIIDDEILLYSKSNTYKLKKEDIISLVYGFFQESLVLCYSNNRS
jgi:hypothetical protein